MLLALPKNTVQIYLERAKLVAYDNGLVAGSEHMEDLVMYDWALGDWLAGVEDTCYI